jgi:soluble lytic murein transglycosylase
MRFLLLLCALLAGGVPAATLDAQRAEFRSAYRAAQQGVRPSAAQLRVLADYPLTPYLHYHALLSHLRALPVSEVRALLARETASLVGARLRTAWLKETARQGRFDLFMADYTPQTDGELRCHALSRELAETTTPVAIKRGLDLWLRGISQPAPCDLVFARLHERGVLNDELVWQRIMLAAHAGNPGLAAAVGRRFAAPGARALARLLPDLANRPAVALRQPTLRKDSREVREVVAYGLTQLARTSPALAATALAEARTRYAFAASDLGRVQRAIALAAAAREDPRLLDYLGDVGPAGVDDAIERLRLREGLRARDWRRLATWTAEPPRGPTTNVLRWRYWHARAREELGQRVRAMTLFEQLAAERDYYGFMASDRLGQPYAFTDLPIAPDAAERSRIAGLAGMRRAEEFYRLGLRPQSQAELDHEFDGRERRAQEVAASVVNDWGWHERAILTLGRIQSYDDLSLRFPLHHRALIEKFARQRGLPAPLVYSIIRGESAFVTDARSPAGALGLMQVMPATAAATARHIGVQLRSPAELTQVEKNLAIGSEYLRQVLRQFGGSFPLAAAAYNAGPSRVKAWVRSARCTPPDLWVDTLPFAETEAYVRRALFYAAIYEWRLGMTVSPLAARMAGMLEHSGKTNSQC